MVAHLGRDGDCQTVVVSLRYGLDAAHRERNPLERRVVRSEGILTPQNAKMRRKYRTKDVGLVSQQAAISYSSQFAEKINGPPSTLTDVYLHRP